jgi:hypothetical protein
MMLRCWCANRGSSVLQSRPGVISSRTAQSSQSETNASVNATIALMQGRAHVRAALYGDDRNGHQNGHQLSVTEGEIPARNVSSPLGGLRGDPDLWRALYPTLVHR